MRGRVTSVAGGTGRLATTPAEAHPSIISGEARVAFGVSAFARGGTGSKAGGSAALKDRFTDGSRGACARAAIRNQAIAIDEAGRGALREFGVALSPGVGAITVGGARAAYRAVAAARTLGPAGVVLITCIAFGDPALGSIGTAVEAIAGVILEAIAL